MKVIKKEVKNCEEKWKNIKVLELQYSHRGEKGKIFVKDFIDSDYKNILKQLRVKVRENYNNFKVSQGLSKDREFRAF